MKIYVSFAELEAVRKKMKAPLSDWRPSAQLSPGSVPNIEIRKKLLKGIEIESLEKVSSPRGLLEHEGEQIVIYIRDNVSRGRAGPQRPDVRDDPEHGKRVHLVECTTIQDMRQRGRFDRYVLTNRRDNLYTVDILSESGSGEIAVDLPLLPCLNCLKELNYKNADGSKRSERKEIARSFDLEEFFETYSTFFAQHPKHRDTHAPPSSYVPEWSEISDKVRNRDKWTCTSCGVVLKDPKLQKWLHAHHKNGVKGDNRNSNVVSLCLLCHSEQPGHDHMHVSPKGRAEILKARSRGR